MKKDGQSVRVDLNDMLYIEAQKHYVNLYLEDQESMNIKTVFTELLQEMQENQESSSQRIEVTQ